MYDVPTTYTQEGNRWKATQKYGGGTIRSRYGNRPSPYGSTRSLLMSTGWNPFEEKLPWTQRATIGSDASRQMGYLTGITTAPPRLTQNNYLARYRDALTNFTNTNRVSKPTSRKIYSPALGM
jgi:hypothetical protein